MLYGYHCLHLDVAEWKSWFVDVRMTYLPNHMLNRDRLTGLLIWLVEMELLGEAWRGTNVLQKHWDEHHPGEVLIVFGAMYDKSVDFKDGAVVMRPMNMKWMEEKSRHQEQFFLPASRSCRLPSAGWLYPQKVTS